MGAEAKIIEGIVVGDKWNSSGQATDFKISANFEKDYNIADSKKVLKSYERKKVRALLYNIERVGLREFNAELGEVLSSKDNDNWSISKRKSNHFLANQLYYISELLKLRNHQSYRAKAFSVAATSVRNSRKDICSMETIREVEEEKGLGPTVSREIREFTKTGKIFLLEELLETTSPQKIFMLSRGISKEKAEKMVIDLAISNYFDLQVCLERGAIAKYLVENKKIYKEIEKLVLTLPGWLSEKRMAEKLLRNTPSVEMLLELDSQYREKFAFDREDSEQNWDCLVDDYSFTIFYSTSESAKRKKALGDWVVIRLKVKKLYLKWVVLTSRYGKLKGKRIVVGREGECKELFKLHEKDKTLDRALDTPDWLF